MDGSVSALLPFDELILRTMVVFTVDLPGARTSGLPFMATLFCRPLTRLCFPGMIKSWFSLPLWTGWKFWGGGTISVSTWKMGTAVVPIPRSVIE